jgi:hypothetical protein
MKEHMVVFQKTLGKDHKARQCRLISVFLVSLCLPNGGSTFRLNAVGITTSNTDNANDGYAATA